VWGGSPTQQAARPDPRSQRTWSWRSRSATTGRQSAATSHDPEVRLYDAASGKIVRQPSRGTPKDVPWQSPSSADGSGFANRRRGTRRCDCGDAWPFGKPRCGSRRRHTAEEKLACGSPPDGKLLASGVGQGRAPLGRRHWEGGPRPLEGHTDFVRDPGVHEGTASGWFEAAKDGPVAGVRTSRKWELVTTLKGPRRAGAVAGGFSPDDRWLVTAGRGRKNCLVWDFAAGESGSRRWTRG